HAFTAPRHRALTDQASSVYIRSLRARVCRRRTTIQPFRVIRQRPRAVFARNPRSHRRSTTAEGGRSFLKNAKSLKTRRSPTCRPRSTQERVNDSRNNLAPHHMASNVPHTTQCPTRFVAQYDASCSNYRNKGQTSREI